MRSKAFPQEIAAKYVSCLVRAPRPNMPRFFCSRRWREKTPAATHSDFGDAETAESVAPRLERGLASAQSVCARTYPMDDSIVHDDVASVRTDVPPVKKGDQYHHPDLREAMIQVAQ